MTRDTARTPRDRLLLIFSVLEQVIEAGEMTGEVVITFKRGCPTSTRHVSHHGEEDAWGHDVGARLTHTSK